MKGGKNCIVIDADQKRNPNAYKAPEGEEYQTLLLPKFKTSKWEAFSKVLTQFDNPKKCSVLTTSLEGSRGLDPRCKADVVVILVQPPNSMAELD